MQTLTIIDTFGILFRSFYALKGMASSKGHPSGMINGFANFVLGLENDKSDLIIYALDSKGKSFRSKLYEEYKTNRQTPPDELLIQLQVCLKMIKQMQLNHVSVEGYEADDIIASLVEICKNKDIFIRIITADKDLYQLIQNGKVEVFSPISRRSYDEQACLEKYGVLPAKIADYLAICGDVADNIPGVKGIGPKGAKTLLEDFTDLNDIYENLDLIANPRTKKLLLESKEKAILSKKLASLYKELDLKYLLNQKRVINPLLSIKDILQEYELKTILKKLDLEQSKQVKKDQPQSNKQSFNKSFFTTSMLTSKEEILDKLSNINEDTLLAFDTESTGLDVRKARLVGFSFAFNETRGYYVPIMHDDFKQDLSLAREAISLIYKAHLIGHNLKFDLELIKNTLGLNYPKKYSDTMILAWLINPSLRANMDFLAKHYFDYDTMSFSSLVPKGQSFANVLAKDASFYAAEDAVITLKFYLYFIKLLDKNTLNLAKDLEFPFIQIILMMEENGFYLDTKDLARLQEKLALSLEELTQKIYLLAGEKFNIKSPKQVGELLFDTLAIAKAKKNKTGYKTDEATLRPFAKKHEIVGFILEYRELAKLISTYCEPLITLAKQDDLSRVHSHFLQTGTATGRLSSNNPNLQNIPSRGRYAKAYKSCFKAQKGYKLISLDYSQIELRLLAHFSKDESLLQAFKEGADIHARTAISIFGELNDANRRAAKSINFGLIYGMGARALSQSLEISQESAKDYIKKYFAAFPSIQEYFSSCKALAKEQGFVKTLFGRKRYFDFKSANPRELAMYERECVNSILQGSAADIIKQAMFNLKPFLDKEHLLLLQIHDELIFEVKCEDAENFAKVISNIMENSVQLLVKLKTSLKVGSNWGELKEIEWI